MIALLAITIVASLLQYFIFEPVLGIVPQLSVLVLVWLSGMAKPSQLACVALVNGLMVAILVPGPSLAIAAGYGLFGLLLAWFEAGRADGHNHFDTELLDQNSLVGFVALGSICVTLLPVVFIIPTGYLSVAVVNALITSLVTALLAAVIYKFYRGWVSSGR